MQNCTQDSIPAPIQNSPTYEGMIKLGEELENPYSVDNMQLAANNLYQDGMLKSKPVIVATHLYVRFLPKTILECDSLKSNKDLIFYDYPLLNKIEGGGTYYHDPSLPEDQITWQYTVVPINYPFGDIKYEILAEVFMDDNDSQLKSANINALEYSLIEAEAYKITDNADSGNDGRPEMKSSSWTPYGTIKVEDKKLGSSANKYFVPLEGVFVRARVLLKTRVGITNSNGYYKVDGSFAAKNVNMCIKWECPHFDIRDGSYFQAYLDKPEKLSKSEGYWNVDMSKAGFPKSWFYAHIHHAAYTYYYKSSQWGLKPPTGRLITKQLHIAGKDEVGTAHYFPFNELWSAATVVVYSEGEYISGGTFVNECYEIFGTTIHELAHVSFWEYGYSIGQYLVDWTFRKAIMTESRSMCVENTITNDIYSGLPTGFYDGREYADLQKKKKSECREKGYTPLFIDLIDNYNQYTSSTLYPKDNVTGYTISELENVLDKCFIDLSIVGLQIFEPAYESFAFTNFQTKLKRLYDYSTEENIDELFDNYN